MSSEVGTVVIVLIGVSILLFTTDNIVIRCMQAADAIGCRLRKLKGAPHGKEDSKDHAWRG